MRQLKAGFKSPGSAGLVVERIGDTKPWTPEEKPTGGESGMVRRTTREKDRRTDSQKKSDSWIVIDQCCGPKFASMTAEKQPVIRTDNHTKSHR